MSSIKGTENKNTVGTKTVTITEVGSDVAMDINMVGDGTATADVAWDYQEITYVGATEDVQTITYRQGGATGTIVRTVTLGYDGSNRVTSITKA